MNEIRTLNVEQACEMLHVHCSTLYQKIATGEIPAMTQRRLDVA